MFEFLTRRVLHPSAFGLDISDLTVKFVRLGRRGQTTALEAFGEVGIPAGAVVDGEIRNEPELIGVLKAGLSTADGRRVRAGYCIASLPEEKSFVRVIELPPLRPEDLGKAVRWEVEGAIPLPASDMFYDYEPVPRLAASSHRDVLVTAFPRSIVQSYHRVLRGAGWIPRALELESQAISRAVVSEELAERSLIIVDLGAVRTSFIIFAGGSLVFTKSVTIGGRDFEAAISSGLGVSPEEARAIKVEAGLSRHYREGRAVELLAPLLDQFVGEIGQLMTFYHDHTRRVHRELGDISAVYLCGGDANLIGLEKYLATAVKRLVVRADPLVRLALPPGVIPPVPKSESLKYTTAIGLALRAAGL